MIRTTKEPHFEVLFDTQEQFGISTLGLMANHAWNRDPRKFFITLARYKFTAKMLSGKNSVLEVGCSDGFCTRMLLQEVNEVTGIDFDPIFIESALGSASPKWPIAFALHDMMDGAYLNHGKRFDGIYLLDVLEHIPPQDEEVFIRNLVDSLAPEGLTVIGMPSIESQQYAADYSKAGHVNCKTGSDLKSTLMKYFHNVLLFSMNDEIVHTGFTPLAHYLFVVCSCPKIYGNIVDN